jgi:hypothetical protein
VEASERWWGPGDRARAVLHGHSCGRGAGQRASERYPREGIIPAFLIAHCDSSFDLVRCSCRNGEYLTYRTPAAPAFHISFSPASYPQKLPGRPATPASPLHLLLPARAHRHCLGEEEEGEEDETRRTTRSRRRRREINRSIHPSIHASFPKA